MKGELVDLRLHEKAEHFGIQQTRPGLILQDFQTPRHRYGHLVGTIRSHQGVEYTSATAMSLLWAGIWADLSPRG